MQIVACPTEAAGYVAAAGVGSYKGIKYIKAALILFFILKRLHLCIWDILQATCLTLTLVSWLLGSCDPLHGVHRSMQNKY